MRRFWARMAAIYGHRWSSAYGERCDDDAGKPTTSGDTWQRGLTGVTEHQIAAGLQACVMSADPWPPTLPAFRAMCLQVPTLAAVKLRMQQGKPDGFVRMLWQNLDGYRLRQADADLADRLIRDAYDLVREHVMAGGALPPEPAAMIRQQKAEHRPSSPATAEKHLAEIAALLQVDIERNRDEQEPRAIPAEQPAEGSTGERAAMASPAGEGQPGREGEGEAGIPGQAPEEEAAPARAHRAADQTCGPMSGAHSAA